MHQPVTGALGYPGHVKRSAWQHVLRDNRKPLLTSEFLKMILIAHSIHLKIEPVQMHRVVGIARVNPSPVYGLADLEDESFSIWPGFPVYRWQSIEGVAPGRVPAGTHVLTTKTRSLSCVPGASTTKAPDNMESRPVRISRDWRSFEAQ
jgi:hypothetical protein